VANFVNNHPRTCTFCDLRGEPGEYSETTLHLFYECASVEENLLNFFRWINRDIDVGYRSFFTGFDIQNIHAKKLLNIIAAILKKCIWDCKLRFAVPTLDLFKETFLCEFAKLHSLSIFIRELTIKSELFLNHNEIHF